MPRGGDEVVWCGEEGDSGAIQTAQGFEEMGFCAEANVEILAISFHYVEQFSSKVGSTHKTLRMNRARTMKHLAFPVELSAPALHRLLLL